MEIPAAIAEILAATATSRFLCPTSPTLLSITAAALPSAALSPPGAVRSDPYRSTLHALARRTRTRTRRRTRSKSLTDSAGDDAFSGDDGPFGGNSSGGGGGWGGSGSGGRGGGGGGGSDREGSEDPSSSSTPDPAFDFVYEVLCWITLSHCGYYALKRLIYGREKEAPIKFVPAVC